jgi:hypothetical protein
MYKTAYRTGSLYVGGRQGIKKDIMHPEKAVLMDFRTGVRFPSPPPNQIPSIDRMTRSEKAQQCWAFSHFRGKTATF